MRNARVLPEPVLAAPRISRPFKPRGIAFAWTSVRFWKWEASRPEAVGCERGNVENLAVVSDSGFLRSLRS